MRKNPKSHAAKKDPIPESVWEQIKTGRQEPWREATITALFGHVKNQTFKQTRVIPAGKVKP